VALHTNKPRKILLSLVARTVPGNSGTGLSQAKQLPVEGQQAPQLDERGLPTTWRTGH